MKKIQPIVYKETANTALWTLILSAVMQAVFLIIGKWNYTVLLGNVLGAATAILNFFLMALGVQRALEKDPADAKKLMKLSQSLRFLGIFVVVAIGAVFKHFHVIAVIIPLLFPRVSIFFRLFMMKKEKKEGENES